MSRLFTWITDLHKLKPKSTEELNQNSNTNILTNKVKKYIFSSWSLIVLPTCLTDLHRLKPKTNN